MGDITIVTHDLFGGAVGLDFPARFVDVSDFRTVPDNQEVFTDANLDQSLIVEIVEHHGIPNEEACSFFFEDLATANDAAYAALSSATQLRADAVPGLPDGIFCGLAVGQQTIGKSRQGAEALNKIHVQLLVVRLQAYNTDMLVTLNTPIFISPSSTAAQQAGAGYRDNYMEAPELFRRIVSTLKIRDWGLFGDPAGQ